MGRNTVNVSSFRGSPSPRYPLTKRSRATNRDQLIRRLHMKSLSPMFAGSFGLAVRRNGSRLAVLLAAFFVIFAAQALAQEATILGTVTDPTGAAVPNAAIVITNIDTGVARNTVTNGDGQYVAPDLHIGSYI